MIHIKYSSLLISIVCFLVFHEESVRAAEPLFTLKGYVYDADSREAILNVTIFELRTKTGTYTNEEGFFSLSLPAKNLQLKISHIGYAEKTITIAALSPDSQITVYLEKSATLLQEVTVTTSKINLLTSPQMGALTINREKIKNIPAVFGEADIIKALQTQPGVSAGTEGLAGMYVRGGNEDENLFMLDGIPLYRVTHLGGLFSAFNVESVDDVVFYKSSFPAQYGGRLSSVLDVRTKSGNAEDYHGSVMLGLTSGNLNIEGPIVKGKTSFNFSARRSWLDALSVPALAIKNRKDKDAGKKITGRYAFTDMNAKINHSFNERSRACINFYYGNDYFKIGEKYFSEEGMFFVNENITHLNWGNVMVSAGWSYAFSDKMKMEVTPSFTHYASALRRNVFDSSGEKNDSDYEERRSEKTTENGIDDTGARIHFDYRPAPEHHINFGGNYIHHRFLPELNRIYTTFNTSDTELSQNSESLSAHETAFYVEDDWSLSPVFRLNAGLRFSVFNVQAKTRQALEPRASVRVLLSEKISLKSSYSRMNQYVQQISDSYVSLPTDFWMPVNRHFKPLVSDQASAGIYYEHPKGYFFSVEGYYKWMNHLLEYREGYSFMPVSTGWDEKLTSGRGRSYGVEWMAQKESGKINGMVSYGLMWSDRQFDEINQGKRFPAKYDNRHKINVVINYKPNRKVEFNGSWTYVTGNRITLSLEDYQDLPSAGFGSALAPSNPYQDPWGISYYETRNNVRLPAYHRLDAGINLYCPKANGRMGIWNISVYNAYCRLNPIVIQKHTLYDGHPERKVSPQFRTIGIFPIIPSISYTYKF
ncbi:MAG: TonB-dependent receptor [Tannerella sp.]|jgi:outer membrane receptor protein involved in Fe transport|nr:TonB-dependent receptor [Tannerella sp.]